MHKRNPNIVSDKVKPLIPPAVPDDLDLGHFEARWMPHAVCHVPLDVPEQF